LVRSFPSRLDAQGEAMKGKSKEIAAARQRVPALVKVIAPYFAQNGWTWGSGVPSEADIEHCFYDLLDEVGKRDTISSRTGRLFVEAVEDEGYCVEVRMGLEITE
jgi:hypothetical protein